MAKKKAVEGPFFVVASQVTGGRLAPAEPCINPILSAAQLLSDTLGAFTESENGLVPDAEPGSFSYDALQISLNERSRTLEQAVRSIFRLWRDPDFPIDDVQLMHLSLEQNAHCKTLHKCAVEILENRLCPKIADRLNRTIAGLKRSLPPPSSSIPPPPTFLPDVTVDLRERTIRRGDKPLVEFGKAIDQWDLFASLYRAGDRGLHRSEITITPHVDKLKSRLEETLAPIRLKVQLTKNGPERGVWRLKTV